MLSSIVRANLLSFFSERIDRDFVELIRRGTSHSNPRAKNAGTARGALPFGARSLSATG